MALSGKYDFRGIKRVGAAGIRSALSAFPALAPLLASPAVTALLEFFANWLANRGLVILNVGANFVDGEFDQKGFDAALDTALDEITQAGGAEKLSAKRIKELDDAVIKAARKFVVVGRP